MTRPGPYSRPVPADGSLRHPAMVCGSLLLGAVLAAFFAGQACSPRVYRVAVEHDAARPLRETASVAVRAPVRVAVDPLRPVHVRPVERAAAEESDVIVGSLASLIDEAP